MSTLADIAREHGAALCDTYQSKMTAVHRYALRSLINCRTPSCGEMKYYCQPCVEEQVYCHSCGHRSCPQCQHQSNCQWLNRQQKKLLPVQYFMVTFTLPYELREFVWQHQTTAYAALFEAAKDTLNVFASNDKHLRGDLGMTAVLHTHSRRLAFHPHIHIIVPAGSFEPSKACWHSKTSKYLFNEFNLAKVFKAKFLEAMRLKDQPCPKKTPIRWVAQCKKVGRGEPALKYLARYLYRGVIDEKNIVKVKNGLVTFRYKDSKTKCEQYRTETAVKFLWLVLQHVLPKGFRRARDYGFLHGNANKTLKRLQLMLKVITLPGTVTPKRLHLCPCCGEVMNFIRLSKRPMRAKFISS